jgi:hypothetical protein
MIFMFADPVILLTCTSTYATIVSHDLCEVVAKISSIAIVS